MLADEKQRIVHGYVQGTGVVLWGVGFSIHRMGTGDHKVLFATPFEGKPTVLAQIHNNQKFISVTSLEPDYCRIVTSATSDGAFADYPFMFVAIGRERHST